MQKKKGIYFCPETSLNRVYGAYERAQIGKRFDMLEPLITRENWRDHRQILRQVEVIVSSWGGAILDEELLEAMPHLEVYFYGAGTIKNLMTDAAWDRGIRITSAAAANAVPVAEFCLAQILFSLKHGWKYMQLAKDDNPQFWQCNKLVPGNYKSKVGIVSFGRISRKLCELLRPLDLEVFVHSDHVNALYPEQLDFTYAPMAAIFATCDVVSIHLPENHKNKGIINLDLLKTMKTDATLINTARGSVINQPDLIQFLTHRTDVTACIDVTDPEPPEPGCQLFSLPNVVLTPHLAGSMGPEARRMAAFMIAEMDRWIAGEPLLHEISREAASYIA